MQNQERFRITSDCVFANVKRIVEQKGDGSSLVEQKEDGSSDEVFGICVEAKLTSCIQRGLNDVRKFYTLEKALRTLVNMVPEPKGIEDMHYHLLHDCNLYQPQEVLGGHPIIEFVLKRSDDVKKSITKSPDRT